MFKNKCRMAQWNFTNINNCLVRLKTLKSVALFSRAKFHVLVGDVTKVSKIKRAHINFNTRFQRFFYNRYFRKPSEQKLKEKDKISERYNLIYRANVDKYLLLSQVFSAFSIGIIVLVVITNSDFQDSTSNYDWRTKPTRTSENEIFVYLGTLVLFVVLIQIMVSRIPVRIYNSPDTKDYTFVMRGGLPFMRKYLYCKAAELTKIAETGILPWKESRYKIVSGYNEHPIILLEHYFRKPVDLNILLGYQENYPDK